MTSADRKTEATGTDNGQMLQERASTETLVVGSRLHVTLAKDLICQVSAYSTPTHSHQVQGCASQFCLVVPAEVMPSIPFSGGAEHQQPGYEC